MRTCPLQQRDDGQWFCPDCDPGQQHLLPVPAQRNCAAHAEPITYEPAAALEEQIESALASELATYPSELIRHNLEICRTNGCDRFTDESNCLWLWRNCDHVRDWFEAICGYERNRHWCNCWGKQPN